ncbi:MAG: fibronectin type III domain-containing protein, partial [Bacteroidia bacterium]|nr:fibronectin type III domain-containing protein [Bacteroidia bacterium]
YRQDVDAEPGDEGWRGNRSQLCIGSFAPDVDGTGKFQEGIDSLAVGGTLFVVNGGVFNESAVVNKDMTIISNGNPVVESLEINNAGGEVHMTGDFQVADALRMVDGIVYLEDADLLVRCGGSIDAVNPAESYVVTLEGGKLSAQCLGVGGDTDPITFPLGTNQGPAPLTLQNTGTSDYISVSADGILRTGGTTGTEFSADAVKVTWFVQEQVAGGSVLNVTAGFSAASELPGFDRNSSALYKLVDGGWNQLQTHGPATGAGPIYTKTVTDLTLNGMFSIQDSLRSCRPNLIVASKAITCDGPSSGRVIATVRFAPGQNFPVEFRLFGPVYRGWQSTGVFNNLPVGNYKVQVRRLSDQTCVAEAPITVSGLQTPIITFINNITTSTARIAWNGDPANRYEIQYRQLNTLTWTTISNLAGSSFILSGLTPATRYEVRIRILCPDASSTGFSAVRIFQTANNIKVESDEAQEVREQLEAAEKEIFSVYPNPTDGPVTLLFGLPEARQVRFVITDLNGRIVAEDEFMGAEGVNRNIIDMSRYASGLYVMKYTDGVKVRTAYIQVK